MKKVVIGERVNIRNFITKNVLKILVNFSTGIDIDITCFGLDKNKKLSDERYMIFYNQKASPNKEIYLEEIAKGKTMVYVNFNLMSKDICYLVFSATIDKNSIMSNIKFGSISILEKNNEILRFDFKGSDFNKEKAIILGELYKKSDWKFAAIGKGFNGGLGDLLRYFGGVEEESGDKRTNVNSKNSKYYFSLISQNMKYIYNLIEDGLRKVNSKINLGNFKNQEKIKTIVKYVLLDNPDIFYVSSEFSILSSVTEAWYQPKYIYNSNNIANYKKKFENRIKVILNKIVNKRMSEYESELAIHNYLVLNVNYDVKSLKIKNPNPEIYSAYGAIMNRKAVCSGYANAAKLLLNKIGISCIIVTGSSVMPNKKSYISHAWNIVKIQRKHYQLDVTWNSPINKERGEIRFDYFNLTDIELAIDHRWNKNLVPKCISKEHNYFKKNNLEINDVYTLKNSMLNVINKKKRVFFFKFSKKPGNTVTINKVNSIINEIFSNPKNNFKGSIKWSVNYNETLSIYKIDFIY